MRGKRRQYDAELKARVALAALKGDKTINEIATLFEIHPNLVSLWRKRALTELPRVLRATLWRKKLARQARSADIGSPRCGIRRCCFWRCTISWR